MTETRTDPRHDLLDRQIGRFEAELERERSRQLDDGALRAGLGLSVALLLAAPVLGLVGATPTFRLTALVWGCVLAALSLLLRARSRCRALEATRLLSEHHERLHRLSLRAELLRTLWETGLPESCSIADVLLLLEAELRSPTV